MAQYPRWEDFNFTPTEENTVNPFGWMGVCMTRGEMDKDDPTPYLRDVDYPPIVEQDS